MASRWIILLYVYGKQPHYIKVPLITWSASTASMDHKGRVILRLNDSITLEASLHLIAGTMYIWQY